MATARTLSPTARPGCHSLCLIALLLAVILAGAVPLAAADPQAERLLARAQRYFAPLPDTMPGA